MIVAITSKIAGPCGRGKRDLGGGLIWVRKCRGLLLLLMMHRPEVVTWPHPAVGEGTGLESAVPLHAQKAKGQKHLEGACSDCHRGLPFIYFSRLPDF